MTTTSADLDTELAERLWEEYQKTNDVSGRIGETAGIDPTTGRVWLGEDILDVVRQLEEEGIDLPLFFVRIGYPYYYRKGCRR